MISGLMQKQGQRLQTLQSTYNSYMFYEKCLEAKIFFVTLNCACCCSECFHFLFRFQTWQASTAAAAEAAASHLIKKRPGSRGKTFLLRPNCIDTEKKESESTEYSKWYKKIYIHGIKVYMRTRIKGRRKFRKFECSCSLNLSTN